MTELQIAAIGSAVVVVIGALVAGVLKLQSWASERARMHHQAGAYSHVARVHTGQHILPIDDKQLELDLLTQIHRAVVDLARDRANELAFRASMHRALELIEQLYSSHQRSLADAKYAAERAETERKHIRQEMEKVRRALSAGAKEE